MANKTWTAADLHLGKLTIHPQGTAIHLERRYRFVDEHGDVLNQIAGGRVVEQLEFVTLPENIRTALLDIDAWTKAQALEQEGME